MNLDKILKKNRILLLCLIAVLVTFGVGYYYNTLWMAVMIAVFEVMVTIFWMYKDTPKKDMPPTDYMSFFVIGIAMFAVGMSTKNPGLWGAGIAFVGLSLAHKDKWGKKVELTKKQKDMRKKIAVLLAMSVLMGLVMFLLVSGRLFEIIGFNSEAISNFEECVAAGYPVMESYPRKCSDGENTFTEDVETPPEY